MLTLFGQAPLGPSRFVRFLEPGATGGSVSSAQLGSAQPEWEAVSRGGGIRMGKALRAGENKQDSVSGLPIRDNGGFGEVERKIGSCEITFQ